MRNGCLFALVLLFILALPLSAQNSLGMVPAPPNLERSYGSATARFGVGTLPPSVSLASKFPKPGSQGNLSSCVAWATAYAVKSYQEHVERGWLFALTTIFSPSFVYNQINGGRDAGSSIINAAELITKKGCATLSIMPYTSDFRSQPSAAALAEAAKYRAERFERLDPKNINSIKTLLAEGQAIIIGMKTYQNFGGWRGAAVYKQETGNYLGGHAMAIVGYDDSRSAFRIINSWGERWGDGGYVWYDYALFSKLCHTAVVMYDRVENTPAQSFPPLNVTASSGAYSDQVRVTWDEVRNTDSYLVYRAEGTLDRGVTEVGEVRGTLFIDKAVKPGTEYFYTVRSKGVGGTSGPSEVAKGWLKSQPQELGIPVNLKAKLVDKAVRLIWDPVETAEGFYVYRWEESIEQFKRLAISKDTGYEDNTLPATPHTARYVVTAFRGTLESKASEGVSVRIEPPAPPAQIPPTPPANLTASQTFSDRIELSWDPVSDADTYQIRRWNDQGKTWVLVASIKATSGAAYIDRSAPAGQQIYSVLSIRRGLTSEPSEIVAGIRVSARPTPSPTPRRVKYADDNYFKDPAKEEEAFFKDAARFAGDSFFSGPDTFFDNFADEEFFFGNPEAFFKFDADKFFDARGFIRNEQDSFFR